MSDSKRANVSGTGMPVPGNDIDTDRIIPARFMKCVTFDGLGHSYYSSKFGEEGKAAYKKTLEDTALFLTDLRLIEIHPKSNH